MGKAIGQPHWLTRNALANCPIFYSLGTVHVPFATISNGFARFFIKDFWFNHSRKMTFYIFNSANVRRWLVNLIYGIVLATIGIEKNGNNSFEWSWLVWFRLFLAFEWFTNVTWNIRNRPESIWRFSRWLKMYFSTWIAFVVKYYEMDARRPDREQKEHIYMAI